MYVYMHHLYIYIYKEKNDLTWFHTMHARTWRDRSHRNYLFTACPCNARYAFFFLFNSSIIHLTFITIHTQPERLDTIRYDNTRKALFNLSLFFFCFVSPPSWMILWLFRLIEDSKEMIERAKKGRIKALGFLMCVKNRWSMIQCKNN